MPQDTYDDLEHEWLDRVGSEDADISNTFKIVMAILMLAAEVRDLTEIIDRRLSSLQGK